MTLCAMLNLGYVLSTIPALHVFFVKYVNPTKKIESCSRRFVPDTRDLYLPAVVLFCNRLKAQFSNAY